MKQLKTIKFPGIDETYYVPEYDLTDYYTKAEVAGLGYMTEAQVQALIAASLPASGEEVSY